MFFKQIITNEMGSLSYLIGCHEAKVACVINPKKNIYQYLDVAKSNDMQITYIFETPDHIDHLSGKMELKFRTGAEIYCLEETEGADRHKIAKEGDIFEFGNALIEIINSPKHDPFSNSIKVTDRFSSNEPWLVLTRTSLFIGDLSDPMLTGKALTNELDDYFELHGTSHNVSSLGEFVDDHVEKSIRMAI